MLNDPGDLLFHGYDQRPFSVNWSASSLLPTEVHSDSDRPDTPRPALVGMRQAAKLPDGLLGGNRRMRAECADWLPQEEEETDTNYRIRVSRSTCFPFYRATLADLAARPFPRELTWDEDPTEGFGAGVFPGFEEFLRDVDGTGKNLTVFGKDALLRAMHRGMEHALVDASQASGESRAATDARRVYAQRIDALSLLDVRDKADASGRKRVIYCRFVTHRVKQSDEWEQEDECLIVELDKPLGAAKGWKREWTFDSKSKKWVAAAKVPYNPGPNGIPLFTLYTNQTGHYEAEPLLEDLAWVNLAHFQSRSDHAHVMRIARLITLLLLGFADQDLKKNPQAKAHDKIVLGPLSKITSARNAKDVSVSFLEPSGNSIELSFKDMEQLADECARLGARHLTGKTGNVTAFSLSLDDAKSVNDLQTFCVRLEVFLRQILDAVAEWLNMGELPKELQPRTNKEFGDATAPEVGARALQALSPALSRRQLLIEAVRHKILRADFPVEENLRELDKERKELDKAMALAAGATEHDDPPPEDDVPDPGDDE